MAPSGWYFGKTRVSSARVRRHEEPIPHLVQFWQASYRVYRVGKPWKAPRRARVTLGRD